MLQKRYPKEVVLKDGKEVTLRPLEQEDEGNLIQFYRELPLSDRWFLKEDPCDPLVIKRWLDNQERGSALGVLGICEDRVVAHASLLRSLHGGRKHVGRLRIMVAPAFRSKRLGTWMVFDLIRRAMELDLDKLRADFVVGVEDVAIEAVRKLDYMKEALLENYVRDEKGNYYDCQIMIKHLHKEWSDF